MDHTDDDFVGYGTSVELIDADESLSKYANENKLKAQKVKDKQGRERFHGAFTGGFSAGYYNTVGTEEGWTPSTFSSKRGKKADHGHEHKEISNSSGSRKPEDYMDEEDLEQFGIAPRQIRTADAYKKTENQRSERAAWDPVVPGITDALSDIIKPVNMSIAVKLLQLMGWKYGQGIGPRAKRKHKQQKAHVVGPARQPGGSSDEDDDFMSHIMFAPKDLNPVKFDVKDDLHGIGYQSLSIQAKSKSSSVEEERLTFGGHSRGISGKAFGVGIEEDDDDADIYGKDKMSDYDMTLGDEPEELHKFTKPSGRHSQARQSKLYQSSAILEGFCLAQKKDKSGEEYTLPTVPRGYRPKAAINSVSTLPKIYGKMDKTLRGLIIGETVQDAGLLPDENELKASESLLPGKSAEINLNEAKTPIAQQYKEDDAPLPPLRSMEPLNKQAVDFKPFAKNPEKQARYERYLMLKRTGDREAYSKVAPAEYRRNDRDREREEFERSGKFFKDLSGIMASRFTRSKQTEEDDDSKVSVRVDEEMDGLQDDKKQAVKMKMFGKLTRESYEWHPHRLLCKRFNIPDPYPNSQLVGLPTVYKDKISAYNFLDVESLTKTPAELKERDEKELAMRELEINEDRKPGDGPTGPKSLHEGEKAPIDLFKAVFQDSESEESESSDEEDVEETKDDTTKESDIIASNDNKKSSFQSLQEKYSVGRTVADMYNTESGSTRSQPDTERQPPKVKFVRKQDRYKAEVKQRKSRWAAQEDVSASSGDISNAAVPESPLSNDISETSQKTIENLTTQNTVITSGNEEMAPSEGVGDKNFDSASPGTPPSPAIHTPPSEGDSDQDSWMPALPPALLNPSAADAILIVEDGKDRHNKKSKDRHKSKHKKKSKSKKSHKEHKKR